MNLWLRLIGYLLGFFRGPEQGQWRFTVGFPDLDVNGHVNNGRYLALMDLGRFDWFWRSGFRKAMIAQRSVPILGGVLIRYRLPLDLGQKIELRTRILCFEENWMIMEQRFVFMTCEMKETVAAIALCKCGFYDRKNRALIDPHKVFAQYEMIEPQKNLCAEAVGNWRAADLSLKDLARAPSPARQ